MKLSQFISHWTSLMLEAHEESNLEMAITAYRHLQVFAAKLDQFAADGLMSDEMIEEINRLVKMDDENG